MLSIHRISFFLAGDLERVRFGLARPRRQIDRVAVQKLRDKWTIMARSRPSTQDTPPREADNFSREFWRHHRGKPAQLVFDQGLGCLSEHSWWW